MRPSTTGKLLSIKSSLRLETKCCAVSPGRGIHQKHSRLGRQRTAPPGRVSSAKQYNPLQAANLHRVEIHFLVLLPLQCLQRQPLIPPGTRPAPSLQCQLVPGPVRWEKKHRRLLREARRHNLPARHFFLQPRGHHLHQSPPLYQSSCQPLSPLLLPGLLALQLYPRGPLKLQRGLPHLRVMK